MENTRTKLQRLNPTAVLFDERFDHALVGLCTIADGEFQALYSLRKIYEALKAQGLIEDEIKEYCQWHLTGLRAGESTPVIWNDLTE